MKQLPLKVGDDVTYRKSPFAESEHVRVVSIEQRKQSRRVEIRFADDAKRPNEKVSDSRICGNWADVAAYDAMQENWKAIAALPRLDDVEDLATSQVIDVLVPPTVADYVRSNSLGVSDPAALEELIGRPLAQLVLDDFTFSTDEYQVLSPETTLRVAEALCRRYPKPVLDMVLAEEAVERDQCKRGHEIRDSRGERVTQVSPERAYYWYQCSVRPRHELLRQWCGHRAVAYFERLEAAEAETRRLDIILARAIDSLRDGEQTIIADVLEREHEGERITPATVRPVVDRPLAPWEIPVREVVRRGRRWW